MERTKQYFQKLDKKRYDSANSWEGVGYFNACNEAGIEPEFPELFELGQADIMFNSIQRGLEKVVDKPRKKRKGSKTGISVRLTPRDAKEVYDNFSFGKENLKSIIEAYVPRNTRKSIDEMGYKELRHYGHVIFGVAKKELKKE